MASAEERVEAAGRDVAQPRGFLEQCEQQWQRSVEHARTYPYVWASYVVVFGGLGVYGAWRWRELRRMENQVMQYQRELLKAIKQEKMAASQVTNLVSGSSSQQVLQSDAPNRLRLSSRLLNKVT